MRGRHHPGKGHSVAHRAHGGKVEVGSLHQPHNAVRHTGEGDRAKLHAARRARGGTCWYCGRDHATGAASGGGIHIKKSHEGLLHKNLHVAEDKHISAKALTKAKHSDNPKVRKRATFAINAKKWHH